MACVYTLYTKSIWIFTQKYNEKKVKVSKIPRLERMSSVEPRKNEMQNKECRIKELKRNKGDAKYMRN